MSSDKQIKQSFKKKASKNPEKFYAVDILKGEGFARKQCKCGTFYWTTIDKPTCGDPSCSGGFQFFGSSPAKNELDYIQVWKKFASMFQDKGYTPIKRYPVAARWRKDTDFVQASIYNFQPYVVSGEVAPPANPLVVPQFCLRFNDIDNVGITGAHYSGFVMVGQHAFMPPQEFDQQQYFQDIHTWLKDGLGLPNKEITFHEDAWAGGGNFGPSMEFFSRGLEFGNQVYMMYEQTPAGVKELKLKVLDMGLGLERNAWFTKGTTTSYETTFPTVCKFLKKKTGVKVDEAVMQKFLPHSAHLNVDETDDINKVWRDIAEKLDMNMYELKENVLPLAAMYSVGEHTRSLLVALNDGVLPSNVGGGYNLRMILRRALGFSNKYGWNIDLAEVAEKHAKYLKPLFPELQENLPHIEKIIEVEKLKFQTTQAKAKHVVERLLQNDEEITTEKLLQLYDSQGITPELVKDVSIKLQKPVEIPDNFYALASELHEEKQQAHQTTQEHKLQFKNATATKALYFHDYELVKEKATIANIQANNVVLDKTVFYPTSGGQLHDTGSMVSEAGKKYKVITVFKQGPIIIHVLDSTAGLKEGDAVKLEVNKNRRTQLAQHHTATHIVNAAARKVLGSHINQAGAKKDVDKAHIDITHYESLNTEQLQEIEAYANQIVNKDIQIKMGFVSRDEAEKKHGMEIYQGGVVPGKELRIVNIPETDVEACGGTHLHSTKEAGEIKILKSSKIQDGVVRITFTAGNAAQKTEEAEGALLEKLQKILNVPEEQLPARCTELFQKWKKAKKAIKKKKELDTKKLEFTSSESFEGDILTECASVLSTQPEHVPKTVSRLVNELEEMKKDLQ
jgi:alanyl-tRNA synthetase